MNIVKDDEEKRNLLTQVTYFIFIDLLMIYSLIYSFIQAKNSEDLTPFMIAANNKNAPICQALKDFGDANANGASGACIIA